MAVLDAYYGPLDGLDLHLLPGMDAPQLNQLLFYDLPGNPSRRADSSGTGVTVTFHAKLRGTPADHGITLVEGTGQLHMELAPAPGLRSFIVTAKGVENSKVAFLIPIRVHVHDELDKLWLTPHPLTLRKGAQGVRLSLLARFTDGVIGDVTNWAANEKPHDTDDLTYARVEGTTTRWLTWFPDGDVAVDPDTGVLTTTGDSGQATIRVEAGPNRSPAATATATVNLAPAWETPVQFTTVGRPEAFAYDSMTQRTNVLILPDGFVDGEKTKFEEHAAQLVGMLKAENHTRPFDLMHKRMNFFIAWVPSPKPGVSVLNEVRHGRSCTEGQEIRFPPRKRGTPAGVWNLAKLVGEVGLPAPWLDVEGSELGTPTSGRLQNWQLRFGTHINTTVVSEALHKDWLALSDRVLVDEVNTAFHTAYSSRPRLFRADPARSMALNPRRLSSFDFDAFLDALHAPSREPLKRWSTGQPDQGNVIILCRSRRHGGANSFRRNKARVVTMSLGPKDRHLLSTTPQGSVAVDPYPIPTEASPWTWMTMAHELAHSWDLQDEYAEDSVIAQPAVATAVRESGNTQARNDLLDPPPPNTGPRILDSKAIKWRWPRLESCGVLRADPEPQMLDGSKPPAGTNPQRYLLKLRPGEVVSTDGSTRHFDVGDIVRLRKRPLATSTMSPQLKVAEADAFAHTLIVVAIRGRALPPDLATRYTTPAGQESIVIKPRRGRDPNLEAGQLGPELEMVSEDIVDWIHNSHNPLNAALTPDVDRPWAREGIDFYAPTGAPALAPPFSNPKQPRYSSWIVGLFEEGAGTVKDVYRPTGICLMRRRFIRRIVNDEQVVTKDLAYDFCPVCRYVLVDRIDPSLHPVIDRDYEDRYFRWV